MKKPFFSIIIPLRIENNYLKETKKHLFQQSFSNFELIVITDKISINPNPSFKRNLGAKMAQGQYLVFLDDDSYPNQDYLENIFNQIKIHPDYSAFCGPCLTPPSDNLLCQASGLFWSSILGSGGAGRYRNHPSSVRLVDDYPTVNLVVSKKAFFHVGGFKSNYWPGEDTVFCLDLINHHYKIFYHPSILVFHHRRPIFLNHLQQIKRYALHRGFFVKIFPKTSFKIGYFLPSAFLIYTLSLPFHHIFIFLYIYLFLLLLQLVIFIFQKKSLLLSLLTILTIPLTHLFYGFFFIVGLLSKDLQFKSHPVDKITGNYVGG